MRLRMKPLTFITTVIVIAGLCMGKNNSGISINNPTDGGDDGQPGTAQPKPASAEPPVGQALRGAKQGVFHHRPNQQPYQIGKGRHVTTIRPTNNYVQRNPDPVKRPYQGGWYKDHKAGGDLKDNGMESNHVPPKKVMLNLDPPWEYGPNSRWSETNASAVELDYEDHRVVSTTGSGADRGYLARLEAILSDTNVPKNDRMADALIMEFSDMQSKLAYHNTQEMVQPDYSDNPHGRPYKDPGRYNEAFKQMIATCYPELKDHPRIVGAMGPFE